MSLTLRFTNFYTNRRLLPTASAESLWRWNANKLQLSAVNGDLVRVAHPATRRTAHTAP